MSTIWLYVELFPQQTYFKIAFTRKKMVLTVSKKRHNTFYTKFILKKNYYETDLDGRNRFRPC